MTIIIEGKIWSYILECPSVIFLIVINLIPLIGVVAFGWNVGFLMLIYWMETVIIGLFNFGHVMFLNSLFDLPTVYLISSLWSSACRSAMFSRSSCTGLENGNVGI